MGCLLFILVALVLLTTSPAPTRFTYSLSSTKLVAGTINDVKITLRNRGPNTAKFVSIKISSSTPGVAVLSPPVVFNEIRQGHSVNFKVRIAVSRGVYGEIVTLNMQITYSDISGAALFTDMFTLSFRVTEISRLELVSVSREGKFVIIKLRNIGPIPINDVSINLLTDDGVIGVPSSYRLSEVGINETVTIKFALKKSREYANLRITYNDGWRDELRIELPRPSHRISVVSVSRKGENVKVKIKNEGILDLENVTISLKYAGALVGIPYRITIPLIAAGDEVEVTFKVRTDLNTVTVSLEYSDGYSEEETVSINIDEEASVDVRCLFPEKSVDLGSKVEYPLWLVNRGSAGIYMLRVEGLPDSVDYRFIKDGVEVRAVYLEEGGQARITLEVEIPGIPVNFTVGEAIGFNISVLTEGGRLAGSLELKLTPVLTKSLRVYSKAWYGEILMASQSVHYPGVPYSTGLLPKGASIATMFRLEASEYAFLLYGQYIGSRCDLNMYIFDLSGRCLAVSANDPGKPELVFLKLNKRKDVIVIVANEEATSIEAGEGVILAVKTVKPPSESELLIRDPLYQACLLVQLPSHSGGILTVEVQGGPGEAYLYRFTTNRDKMKYDPFLPKEGRLVSFNDSTSISYQVIRGEELILLMIKAESDMRIHVRCGFSGGIRVSTKLYEKDLATAIALIVTAITILIILRGERMMKLSR